MQRMVIKWTPARSILRNFQLNLNMLHRTLDSQNFRTCDQDVRMLLVTPGGGRCPTRLEVDALQWVPWHVLVNKRSRRQILRQIDRKETIELGGVHIHPYYWLI